MKFIVLFLAITLSACEERQVSTVKDTSVDLPEGRLVYSVSGDGTSSDWTFEVKFDSNNVLIHEEYARGAGKKYIYDKRTKEVLALIDDAASFVTERESYFIYYTPEELVDLALSSNYGDTSIAITQEFREILGYKCQKWVIKHGNQVTVEVWITDKIKTGIIYPWTPLTFESVALEYELKILGKVDRRYVIKSVADSGIGKAEFEHKVPEEYYLVVPLSVFSLDSTWAVEYKESSFTSFTYPFYGNGREATKHFLKEKLSEIIKDGNEEGINIDFVVSGEGKLKDIIINYGRKNRYTEQIKRMLEDMPRWTPAMVIGMPVSARVRIAV